MNIIKIIVISLLIFTCMGTVITGCAPMQGVNDQQEDNQDKQQDDQQDDQDDKHGDKDNDD